MTFFFCSLNNIHIMYVCIYLNGATLKLLDEQKKNFQGGVSPLTPPRVPMHKFEIAMLDECRDNTKVIRLIDTCIILYLWAVGYVIELFTMALLL